MKPELRIGVVDSGHTAAQRPQVVAGRRFYLVEDGVGEGDLREDPSATAARSSRRSASGRPRHVSVWPRCSTSAG